MALAQEGSDSLEKEARKALNSGQFKKAALKFESSAAATTDPARRSKMYLQAAWSQFNDRLNDRRLDASRDALRRALTLSPDMEIVPEFFSPEFMKVVEETRAANRPVTPAAPPVADLAETKRVAREKLADGNAEEVVHDLTYNVPREKLDQEVLGLLASAYEKLGRFAEATKARADATLAPLAPPPPTTPALPTPSPAALPSPATPAGPANDFLSLGRAALSRGDALNAQAAANRLLEVEPTSSEAYRILGEAFLARGEKPIAEANLKQSLRYNERNEATLLVLYEFYLGEKNWESALEALRKATEINPENREKLLALGRKARADGDLPHAKQTFAAAAAALPNDASILTEYAMILLELKDIDGALDPLVKAAKAEPGRPVVRTNLAIALRRKGLAAESEREYREALLADPDTLPALIGLANLLLDRQNAAEALEHVKKAVALSPLNADAAWLLGRALRTTGNYIAAAEALQKAKDLGSPEIWDEAGAVAYERGKYAEAVEWFDRALAARPEIAVYRANRDRAARAALFVQEAGVTPMASAR
jgi:tetratricopeptide (TPR) repeat protein